MKYRTRVWQAHWRLTKERYKVEVSEREQQLHLFTLREYLCNDSLDDVHPSGVAVSTFTRSSIARVLASGWLAE